MSEQSHLDQFDEWIRDDSQYAAIVMRQWLIPVEGKDAVIFPPTYPIEESKAGYNIDRLTDGSTICQIDSVGSQGNRIEPIFKKGPYSELVPQVVIKAENKSGEKRRINILDAGHRAADAIVRFSELSDDLDKAYRAFRDEGDAAPLARIAPTSIVFGSWDSRATQVKFQRILRLVIRAYGVEQLHRSAQYIPPIDYVETGLLDSPEDKKKQEAMSKCGFSHAPAAWTHGGIIVRGEIRKDAALNLVAIRALGTSTNEESRTLSRYILGLALVCFTAPQETSLREGCQLVVDPDKTTEWKTVKHDGSTDKLALQHHDAVRFAKDAALAFGVKQPEKTYSFDPDFARKWLQLTDDQRKKLVQEGGVTKEKIEKLQSSKKKG